MVWGFCVYFVYMIPLETDVLRKHRFQKWYFLQDKYCKCCNHNQGSLTEVTISTSESQNNNIVFSFFCFIFSNERQLTDHC